MAQSTAMNTASKKLSSIAFASMAARPLLTYAECADMIRLVPASEPVVEQMRAGS